MCRVLLVDDEKNVLRSLSIGLRRHNYSVVQAQNGPEALRIMEKEPCDVLVSDIRMNPMDGYTLADQVHERYPGLEIVLMSAYGFENSTAEKERGYSYHRLTKPFPVSDLIHILQNADGKEEEHEAVNASDKTQKRVMVFGEAEEAKQVCGILDDLGYDVDLFTEEKKRDIVDWSDYDLFIMEESCLEGDGWRALNDIDQHASERPVIIFSNNGCRKDTVSYPDLSLTVIQKNSFLNDRDWARRMLLECLKTEENA